MLWADRVGDPRTHDCRLSNNSQDHVKTTLTRLTCSEAGQLSSQLVKKMSRDTLHSKTWLWTDIEEVK